MNAAGSTQLSGDQKGSTRVRRIAERVRSDVPSIKSCPLSLLSASLLVLAFPNFDLWPLAWVALVPLLIAVARRPSAFPSFLLGWIWGTVFFFASCHWLTYSIINFGGFSPWLAYPMLIPGALTLGIFPGLFAFMLARVVGRFGLYAILLAALFWPPLEWARLEVTGQLWNAIGYSQAFHPWLIQTSRWSGVYGVGFLILLVNAAIALTIVRRTRKAVLVTLGVIALTGAIIGLSNAGRPGSPVAAQPAAVVVGIQPNVPMELVKSIEQLKELSERHFTMSEAALAQAPNGGVPRLLVWPESPMNFTYGTDATLRERLANFARQHRVSILLNSQEVAPNDGVYNSALLLNEQGSLAAQYDKIRLLPFGEYVPLPEWLPGAGLIRGIVGDFTPGVHYRLLPVGDTRAGVFICIESAYPSIARRFTSEGADVLINISNDGYLGPTAVMRQHLANAIFRAVENDRDLLRITNTGITAFITARGEVKDPTGGFQQDVRSWSIARAASPPSFYARHGDVFAALCGLLSLAIMALSWKRRLPVKLDLEDG